jgi:phosphoglycerate dehydrogenase-like enzyme
MPNVFVTPHIGGATTETLARGARRAVAAVADLLAGRVPSDVVNPQVLRAGSRAQSRTESRVI